MNQYETKDAVMLKECMRIISEIAAKYPNGAGQYLKSVPDDLKQAIEFIQDVVSGQDKEEVT